MYLVVRVLLGLLGLGAIGYGLSGFAASLFIGSPMAAAGKASNRAVTIGFIVSAGCILTGVCLLIGSIFGGLWISVGIVLAILTVLSMLYLRIFG